MTKAITCFFLTIFSQMLFAQNIWINEVNYENFGSDTDEFVEIGGESGTNLSGYKLVFINGNDNKIYKETLLSGIIPDEKAGIGAVNVSYATTPNSIQNGAPDGIAIVKNDSIVVEFLSYEGAMKGWIFFGKSYNSISVTLYDLDNYSPDKSIQLLGSNVYSTDWAIGDISPGKLNDGQSNPILGIDETEQVKNKMLLQDAQWFTIEGKTVELNNRMPGQLYIVKWLSENHIFTSKVIF